MCETGLDAPLVWYLHDMQVVKHMLHYLSELTGYDKRGCDEENESRENAEMQLQLRGEQAEESRVNIR